LTSAACDAAAAGWRPERAVCNRNRFIGLGGGVDRLGAPFQPLGWVAS
jgi:hypothetical protein